MENLFYSPYFTFYTIFSDTATLEKSLRTTSYQKFGWIFCLFWLSVYMQKISVIQSFHQNIYVESLSSYNSRTTIPQIWDLYSKTDINFYSSTSPVRINGKIYQYKGKTLFWSQQLSTTAVVPQHLNVKDIEYIFHQTKNYFSLSVCKNRSVNLLNLLNHL